MRWRMKNWCESVLGTTGLCHDGFLQVHARKLPSQSIQRKISNINGYNNRIINLFIWRTPAPAEPNSRL